MSGGGDDYVYVDSLAVAFVTTYVSVNVVTRSHQFSSYVKFVYKII